MYAIIQTGGKQYKVKKNDILAVEKLSARGGDKVQFNTVLLTGGNEIRVGDPLVKGAGVQATVIDQIKDKKVISFVKRRRKSSSKSKKGHRQQITLLKITDIIESGADKTNIQEANSGKGLQFNYSATVNNSKKNETLVETVEAKPAKKTQVKKEPKAQKETKAVKTASVAKDTKKKDTTKKPTAVKKEVKKKST